MFDKIREDIINFITNRITLLTFLFLILGCILIYRCFDLQIVQGQEYLDKFILQAEKSRDIASSRGSIYDCNRVLLAYDDLAYSVKIEDVYESGSGKNKKLNATIYKLIKGIEKNGDSIIEDFNIFLVIVFARSGDIACFLYPGQSHKFLHLYWPTRIFLNVR